MAVAVLCVGALASSCADDPSAAYVSFAARYAKAVCLRASTCCASADFVALYGTDQTTCERKVAGNPDEAREAFSTGLVRFDRGAAEDCLARIITDTCPLVYRPLPASCPVNATVGTRKIGEVCDADFMCASRNCTGQLCVERPAPLCDVCLSGEYCGAAGCTTVVPAGGACTYSPMCEASGACVNLVCAGLVSDGGSCTSGRDCATGTCSNIVVPAAAGTCRPSLCQGT